MPHRWREAPRSPSYVVGNPSAPNRADTASEQIRHAQPQGPIRLVLPSKPAASLARKKYPVTAPPGEIALHPHNAA